MLFLRKKEHMIRVRVSVSVCVCVRERERVWYYTIVARQAANPKDRK